MKKTTKYLLVTTGINLFVAFIMLWGLLGFDFSEVFNLIQTLLANNLVAITAILLSAYLIGQYLYRFKHTGQSYRIIHGVFAIFAVLLIGIFAGTSVAFIQQGWADIFKRNYPVGEVITDYYLIPFYAILLLGTLPTLISGIILGIFLRKIEDE